MIGKTPGCRHFVSIPALLNAQKYNTEQEDFSVYGTYEVPAVSSLKYCTNRFFKDFGQ
jgi:hypothetical protein